MGAEADTMIRRLQIRIDFIDDHVLVRLTKYSLNGELRDVLQIADWSTNSEKPSEVQASSAKDELTHTSIDQHELVCRERLMTLMITGNRISMQPTTRGVGIGSSEQNFLGVASMSFWTSDSFNSLKLSIGCTTGESAKHFSLPGDTVVVILSSLFCMTTIF